MVCRLSYTHRLPLSQTMQCGVHSLLAARHGGASEPAATVYI
jgi:hypothetical protein